MAKIIGNTTSTTMAMPHILTEEEVVQLIAENSIREIEDGSVSYEKLSEDLTKRLVGEDTYIGHNAYYIEAINTAEKWIKLSESTTKPDYPNIGSNVKDKSLVNAPYAGVYEATSNRTVTITNETGHTVTLEEGETKYFYLIKGHNELLVSNEAIVTFNKLDGNGLSYEDELTIATTPLTSDNQDKVSIASSLSVNGTITVTANITKAGIYYIQLQFHDSNQNLISIETDTGFCGNIQQYRYGWNFLEFGEDSSDLLMVYLREGENTFHITNKGSVGSYINTLAIYSTGDLGDDPQYTNQFSISSCKVTPAYTSSKWTYSAQDQAGYFNRYAGGTDTNDELAPGDSVEITAENMPYTGVYAFQLYVESISGGDVANVRVLTEDGYYSDYELTQSGCWTNRMTPPKDMPIYLREGDNTIRIINIGASTIKLDDTDCGRLDAQGADKSLDFIDLVRKEEVIQYKRIDYDTGYAIGDEFSILNGPAYDFCGYISQVEGNKIYYEDDLPFNVLDTSSGKSLDHIFFVPSKPHLGLVTIVTNAYATGIGAKATGKTSFASGMDTIAGGGHSVVGGRRTYASYCSTAFGLDTYAKGRYAFTAGRNTRALGEYSTALNMNSIARGEGAFAHGKGTQANTEAMEAGGMWNETTGGKIVVYGNGTPNADGSVIRSDAYTLDWNGIGWYAGGLKIGGSSQDDAEDVLVRSQIISLINQYSSNVDLSNYTTWAQVNSIVNDKLDKDYYTAFEVNNIIDTKISNAITSLIGGSY